jgi:hypothetical protein
MSAPSDLKVNVVRTTNRAMMGGGDINIMTGKKACKALFKKNGLFLECGSL